MNVNCSHPPADPLFATNGPPPVTNFPELARVKVYPPPDTSFKFNTAAEDS